MLICLETGNELMRQEQYSAAVESYTQAIQLDSKNAVYYCNRSVGAFSYCSSTKRYDLVLHKGRWCSVGDSWLLDLWLMSLCMCWLISSALIFRTLRFRQCFLKFTRVLQPVATCCHYCHISISQLLWRHSHYDVIHYWAGHAQPYGRTYVRYGQRGHLTAFNM